MLASPPNQIIAMEFSPELPYQKKDILEAMPMASLRKTYVIYKTAFWLKKVRKDPCLCDVEKKSLYRCKAKRMQHMAQKCWSDKGQVQFLMLWIFCTRCIFRILRNRFEMLILLFSVKYVNFQSSFKQSCDC